MEELPLLAVGKPNDYVSQYWLDSTSSELEHQFGLMWVDRYPEIHLYAQYEFAKRSHNRKYSFDFVEPISMVAIEINGGTKIFKPGGHNSPEKIQRDATKTRIAQALGWLVMALTSDDVVNEEAYAQVYEAIARRRGEWSE